MNWPSKAQASARPRRWLKSAAAGAAIAFTTIAFCQAAPRADVAPPHPIPPAVADLQRAVDGILADPSLDRMSWGVLVRSLRSGETLVSLNPGKLMMPASTMKVVTLAATAERLGWDYSYETRLVADGSIAGDTLSGDLVVIANGDPSLNRPTLDAWAAQLRMLGITRITGTIVPDARAFEGERLGAGWSWDDLAYYYAAPIAAAQFRENAVDVTVRPGPTAGMPPIVEAAPAGSGLRIDIQMTTGTATAVPEFAARRTPDSTIVTLEGVVPAGSRPVLHPLSVPDPPRFLAAAVLDALLAGGISVGAPVGDNAGRAAMRDYTNATPLLTHRSEPLRMLARRLMEASQNQYAETFIKTLGVQTATPTFDGGVKVVESVLGEWGVPPDSSVIRDGSGLSRYNYLAPEVLVDVLTRMFDDPAHNEPFFGALSIAGRTGTVAARLRNTPAAGNARVKDGSMSSVRALCGVITAADGEPLVFAILGNSFSIPGPSVTAAIDAIVVRLASFKR